MGIRADYIRRIIRRCKDKTEGTQAEKPRPVSGSLGGKNGETTGNTNQK